MCNLSTNEQRQTLATHVHTKIPDRGRETYPLRNRLEITLMRLRISILQQSAASGKGDSSSGDEKQNDADSERRRGSRSPAAVAEKWTAMFEARDRAGTGRATMEVLQGVLEEVKWRARYHRAHDEYRGLWERRGGSQGYFAVDLL